MSEVIAVLQCPRCSEIALTANLLQQKALLRQGFLLCGAVKVVKGRAVLFTFGEFYGIITLDSYLIDKLEFVGELYENTKGCCPAI